VKKLGLVFVFWVGVCIGLGGLLLIINNNEHVRYYLLELPTRNQPESNIDAFVQALIRDDHTEAVRLWEIQGDTSLYTSSELKNRRESVISDLTAEEINPEYIIMDIEWWRTCCELSVIHDTRDAGGARIRVQFLDPSGNPLQYTSMYLPVSNPILAAHKGIRNAIGSFVMFIHRIKNRYSGCMSINHMLYI